MNSYGVRCVFEAPTESFNTKRHLYEERITVWSAESLDDALDKAVAEANAYSEKHSGYRFSGLSQGFSMFPSIEADGVEVFSLLRESDLELDEYLDSFFSTGDERQQSDDRRTTESDADDDATQNA